MKKSIILFLILAMYIFTSCGLQPDNAYEADGFGMGTVISQKIYGVNSKKAADEVFENIKYLEGLMTVNASGGDINRLNENAGKANIELAPETIAVIKSALKISKLSEGAFDITVAPVVKAWGIGTDEERIPSDEELGRLVSLIGYKNIYVEDKIMHRASLKKQGQMIDLGGIAKGYAADKAIKIYKNNGIGSAFINLGGNVFTLGTKPDGTLWSIGIQNPRAGNGKIVGFVKVSNKAVVTSGDYQRYFEKNGKKYHHIMDPRTGRPAESGLMSVTIIAASATEADALSTAAFVLGLDKGMSVIKRYGHAEAIFITADKKIYITQGLKENFQFKDESQEYEYVKKR